MNKTVERLWPDILKSAIMRNYRGVSRSNVESDSDFISRKL